VDIPEADNTQPGDRDSRENQPISLIRNEIRRLFAGLCQQRPAPRLQLH
jgi:hypothetical protein